MIKNVQCSLKYVNLRAALNKTVSRVITLFGKHLGTSAVIRS